MQKADSKAKQAAGFKAAELVEPGMLIGLGTGSTAAYFIQRLSARCREGLKCKAVATSKKAEKLALELGVPLIPIDSTESLDLDIDGADEIDPMKRMIKGGGGALLREKIVAHMSREMIVIVDQEKLVDKLGAFPLPVEILPFGMEATLFHLASLGYEGKVRKVPDQSLFITDNGNHIFDIHYPSLIDDPELEHEKIRSVPGVIDTGFFFRVAGRVIVGYEDGTVQIRS